MSPAMRFDTRIDDGGEWWGLVLIGLVLSGSTVSSVLALEDDFIEPGTRALRSWLAYAEARTAGDGRAAPAFAPRHVVRGTALLGQLVTGIHVGLLDSPSLLLLNRIADYINTRIGEGALSLTSSTATGDELLTLTAVSDFLSGHYALTSSSQSRANLMLVADSLVLRLGWSPLTSRLAALTNALRIQRFTGGSIAASDIEASVKDLLDHQLDFVDFGILKPENIPLSLRVLSALYGAALRARITIPVEAIALWEVYRNYTVTALPAISVTPENYSRSILYLGSLVDALDIAPDAETLAAAQSLAVELLDLWQSGDRLLRQPYSPLEVYTFDPNIDYNQLLTALQAEAVVWKLDLQLPAFSARLANQPSSNATLIDKFHSAHKLALSRVTEGEYLPLLEAGSLPTEGFVDRLENTGLVAEWFGRRRMQKEAPIDFLSLTPPQLPLALISSLLILIILGFLYARGRLFPQPGGGGFA